MKTLAKINSWFKRIKIGQTRYIKDNNFIIGSFYHFPPPETYTQREIDSLRFCIVKQKWSGFRWRYIETLIISKQEFKELLKDKI